LRSANQSKDELLGLVSHELRNPLSTILAAVRRISLPGIVVPDEQQTVKLLDTKTSQLAVLIENMLILARGDHTAELEPVLLHRLLGVAIARHLQRSPDRKVELELGADVPIVAGHDGWLHQVLDNLLGNAEKYFAPETTITVAASAEGGNAVVRVLDRGPGIPVGRAEQLFAAFHREKSTSDVPGLGLGLAVCRRLVELQGGAIWAAERKGGGAEFGFSLPAVAE